MVAENATSAKAIISTTEIDEFSVAAANTDVADELIRQGMIDRIGKVLRPTVPPILDALIESAKKNASGLPRFANRSQFKANLLTTMSNTLAALTGLAIWATLQESPAWWAKAVVASAALLSAVLGFLPTIFHWNENATKARQLASDYGRLYGDLLEIKGQVLDCNEVNHGKIAEARATMEALKKQRQEINAEW